MNRFVKRLRLAWWFKVWPWRVSSEAVTWLSLEPPTERDIQRTAELIAEGKLPADADRPDGITFERV